MQGGHNKLSQKIVGSKFYCPHALADSNQCTQVREKTLEFFSVVLPVPSLYLHIMDAKKYKTEKSGNWPDSWNITRTRLQQRKQNPSYIARQLHSFIYQNLSIISINILSADVLTFQVWKAIKTRMWANAKRDGRPAEHRWRPLFNAAKFGWRPLLHVVQ